MIITVAESKEQILICYLSGLVNSSVKTETRQQNTQVVHHNLLQEAKLQAAETF